MNNGEKLYLHLSRLEEGENVLKVYMPDPFLTFTKFVIYTRERRAL